LALKNRGTSEVRPTTESVVPDGSIFRMPFAAKLVAQENKFMCATNFNGMRIPFQRYAPLILYFPASIENQILVNEKIGAGDGSK